MTNISVVMATCNGEKYLDKQIQSILQQTLKPTEIIVCDDVSTDSTVSILEKYRQEGQLKYIINDNRLGFIGNFKKAVSLANTSNYIALADQDDEWMPDKLEKSAKFLKQLDDGKTIALVYTDLLWIDQHEIILNKSFRNVLGQDKYEHNLQTLLFNNVVTGCTILMNHAAASFFAEIPNDVPFHDEWMALVAFTFGKAESIKLPLVKYRRHDNNASIAADIKIRSRPQRLLLELIDFFKGKDDFLANRFKTVQKFYDQYHSQMKPISKSYYEEFLKLCDKPYFIKKLAFRKMVKKFRTN